jgi:4-amino-4-deoxy-L-arabinose transferase-like glycosyltransferase
MLSIVRRHPLICTLLGALAVRVLIAFALQSYLDHQLKRPFLISGDAEGYWELGERMAHGQPYELYDPPRRVLRMPGYPAFVAASIWLAEQCGVPNQRYLIARLLLSGVGVLACALVCALGTELFGATSGTVAAVITAFAPPLAVFSVVLLSETLFAAAMLASLWGLAHLVRSLFSVRPMIELCGWSALAGLLIGVAVYIRPSWLLVAPCFAVLIIAGFRMRRPVLERLLVAAIVVACAYGSLLPWAYRNDQITGHWIFTTLWVGPSLYDGLNPDANGDSNLQFFENERLLDHMSEYDMDRHYRKKAWEFVRSHPSRALDLTAIKLWRYWKPWPSAELASSRWTSIVGGIVVAAYFIPMVVLAVWGWMRGPRHFWGWTLAIGPILYFSLIHAVFLGSLRYRLPAEYPLCIAAAVGIVCVLKRPDGPAIGALVPAIRG